MENDLKFSGESPVVINYNGNAEDIYAPVRTSSADINIVTDKILDDMYSARKDEVCVRIEKDGFVSIRTVYHSEDTYTYSEGAFFKLIKSDGTERPAPEIISSDNVEYTFYDKDGDICCYFRIPGSTNYNNFFGVYDVNRRAFIENDKWGITNLLSMIIQPGSLFDTFDKFHYITDGSNTYIYYKMYENANWYLVKSNNAGGWGTPVVQQDTDFNWATPFNAWAYNGVCYAINHTDGYLYILNANTLQFERDTRGFPYNIMRELFFVQPDGIVYYRDSNNYLCVITPPYNNAKYYYNNPLNNGVYFSDFPPGPPSGSAYQSNLYLLQKDTNKFYLWKVDWVHSTWSNLQFTRVQNIPTDFSYNLGGFELFLYKKPGSFEICLNSQNSSPTWRFSITSGYLETVTVYETRTVWEGYKMPNTFSQELTLNLDSVQMTAIDPVSILKYVTIDRLLEKPKIVTYRELIGSALSYVMLSVNLLSVESSVSYGGVYDGTNGLLDLQVQVSNFWDESDKPATVYEMIEEILRPFCMVLAYEGDRYVIYNQNKTTGSRNFINYEIGLDGSLTELVGATEPTYIHNIDTDWISNNVSNATMEINNTYEKVSGVASTMIPTYSTMAMDLIDYTQRDLYEADGLNVQTNKTRGIKKVGEVYSVDAADKWFYIWNGVYVNPEYKLEPWSSPVDWYLNINKAYEYLTGTTTGYGADTGSILNFYGGTANPTATGKEQVVEKSVEVKRRITAYAADNGVPPEFLETADLAWTYSGSGSGSSSSTEGHISKSDSSDAKFGSGIEMGDSDRIIYRQKYEHINMTQTNNPVVDVDISRSFSRTGINTLISVMNNNTATNCSYSLIGSNLVGCDTNYYPPVWNSENIVVNSIYFKRYSAGSTIRCREIWDRRRIDMYITLSDGTYLQFNGKEWVSVSSVSENDDSNSFYLMRLMNNEYLFHTEQRYPVIETSDGEHFALGTESFIYFRDNLDHGVYDHDPGTSGEKMECPPYAGAGQIKNSSEGFISVNLPYVNDPEAAIYVDVYNSSMLGMTGSDTIGSAGPVPFYYPKKNESGYKEIWSCWCDFLPKNLTHIKAEHLDLSISVSTPESNLGQMFSESDIRYEIDSKNDYVEEYDGPSFRVNTFNQLVASSFSYLLFDNAYADPGQFIINGQAGRPECYVVQAYMNWLGTIRKIYNKTIKPLNDGKFSNIMTFIASPEIGENPLMVISDSWDLKTNRHTISSIEDQNIDVEYVMTVDAIELPRMARADRYNLPTAKKK